jgi:hypothetical protein
MAPDQTDLRAERRVVEQAAAALRSRTAQDVYIGLVHPEMAYSLCSVLDEIGRHWRDLDDDLRQQVVQACAAIEAAGVRRISRSTTPRSSSFRTLTAGHSKYYQPLP